MCSVRANGRKKATQGQFWGEVGETEQKDATDDSALLAPRRSLLTKCLWFALRNIFALFFDIFDGVKKYVRIPITDSKATRYCSALL